LHTALVTQKLQKAVGDAIELTSPVAAQLFGTSGGKVVGKASLRTYFQRVDADFQVSQLRRCNEND
jgi:hypothetical protein